MTGSVRDFDRLVLKPCAVLLYIAAITLLIGGNWLWLAGAVLAIFYVGIIGAKLHPSHSFSDLARDPTTSPTAKKEDATLTPDAQRYLIDHACTRVGLVIGAMVGLILWKEAGWRWYFALLIGYISLVSSGGLLKFTFTTARKHCPIDQP